jgi:hypothetical protein
MSGTGTVPVRDICAIGVSGITRLVAAARGRLSAVRHRGGLTVPVAVPAAVIVAAAVLWATVAAASTWVSA